MILKLFYQGEYKINEYIWTERLMFLQGLFPPGQGATIGVDFMIKTVDIKGEKVKVQYYKIFKPLRLLNLP